MREAVERWEFPIQCWVVEYTIISQLMIAY